MAKVAPVAGMNGEHLGWMIQCPGCGNGHFLDGRWTFNDDVDRPSFGPVAEGKAYSVMVRSNRPDPAGGDKQVPTVCHSYIEDGHIRYLDDCTHELRGQTVALEDWKT